MKLNLFKKIASLTLCTLVLFLSETSFSQKKDILFEGYHKILSGGVHIGYSISRYEYDPKAKQFIAVIFNKTGALGSDVTESIKAIADANLDPVSYEYTALVGKTVKTIDAKFKKGRMSATVKDNGKTSKIEQDIPKNVFLSQFLVYRMLKSKTGLQADIKYDYDAIAEEDGKIYKGLALIEKMDKYNGLPAFRILNSFKEGKDNLKFVAFVTDRGEILGVTNPGQSIASELVAKPNEATGQFGIGATILKNLFGDVPLGTNNTLSRALKAEALKPAETTENPKQKDVVPPGQGIILKTQPEANEKKTK